MNVHAVRRDRICVMQLLMLIEATISEHVQQLVASDSEPFAGSIENVTSSVNTGVMSDSRKVIGRPAGAAVVDGTTPSVQKGLDCVAEVLEHGRKVECFDRGADRDRNSDGFIVRDAGTVIGKIRRHGEGSVLQVLIDDGATMETSIENV